MPIKHVLIVDDSKSARLVLRKMLQNINLDVDMAASGEEALDYLNDNYPDAIFMDHAMPGLDGLQVVKKIRENPNTEMIPIAMYTSREEESYREQIKAYGIVDILPKPAAHDTLSQVINKLNTVYEEVQIEIAERKSRPSATPTFQSDPGASIEVIQDIAQASAESAIENALNSQIMPLVEGRIFQLREDILTNIEVSTSEIAGQLYEKHMREFSKKLERQIDAQINGLKTNLDLQLKMDREEIQETQKKIKSILTQQSKESLKKIAEQTAHQIANEICDTRIREYSSQLTQQFNNQLTNLKSNLEAPIEISDETYTELQNKLKPILTQQANKSAWLAAEQIADEITDKTTQDIDNLIKSMKKHMYMLTGLAMLTGIMAAGVVYYIQ